MQITFFGALVIEKVRTLAEGKHPPIGECNAIAGGKTTISNPWYDGAKTNRSEGQGHLLYAEYVCFFLNPCLREMPILGSPPRRPSTLDP